jgi:hypothetical protein
VSSALRRSCRSISMTAMSPSRLAAIMAVSLAAVPQPTYGDV